MAKCCCFIEEQIQLYNHREYNHNQVSGRRLERDCIHIIYMALFQVTATKKYFNCLTYGIKEIIIFVYSSQNFVVSTSKCERNADHIVATHQKHIFLLASYRSTFTKEN
jgi:hypothetical protein